MAEQIASLFAKIGADTSGFDKAMRGVKDDIGGLEKGFTGLQSVVGTGLKMAAGVGVAAIGGLATGIGVAVKNAADMEQGIANIAATMGLTKDETDSLKGVITDLGLDPKLKVTAVEAAQAIEMLGKNGLSLEEIMGGAARSTVLLQNSVGGDFANAADIATDVMSLFNIEAADMSKAVDSITGVTTNSKLSIDDYRLALAQAGGVSAAVGTDFNDFNAVIAAISPSFASGSDLGTSFKVMQQRLVPTTEAAKDALAELGLMTDQGTSAFFTAEGQMKSWSEIADLLNGAFAGLSDAQRNQAASTIFGTDAMRAGLALADAGGAVITDLKNRIGDTSAEEAAATRMNTLSGSWEIFTGIVETLALGIGDKFLPIARRLTEWASEMASRYGPMVIEWAGVFAERISELVRIVGQGVLVFEDGSGILMAFMQVLGIGKETAQVVGQAIFDLMVTVQAFISPVVDAIAQFISWQDVLMAVGAVIASIVIPAIYGFLAAAAPVIAVFAALVLASAVLRAAWTGDWSGIIDFVTKELPTFANKLMEWGKAAWEWLTAAIPLVIKAVSDWAQALYKWINDNAPKWLDTLGKWGKSAWEWIVQATSTAVQKLGEWGSGLLRWLSDNLPNWIKMIYEWATALVEWITDAIPGAITALTNFIHGIRTKGESEGTPAFVKLVGEWATKFWRWIVDDLIPAVGPAFVKFITALMTLGQELLVAIGGLAMELGLLLWEWIVAVTPVAVQKLGEWGKALWGWIQDNMPEWVAKLEKWATAAWEWIVAATGPALQKLGEWGKALWGWIQDNAPSWMRQLAIWAAAAWEWIVDMTPVALQKLSEFGRQLISWVGEKSREWATKFLEAGRDLIDGFRKGIEEKWTSMTSWFSSKWTDLANKFKNFFGIHSPSTMFRDFGNDLMAGLKGGIEDGALHPVNAAASVASRVKEQMDAMIREVNNSAAKINAVVFNPGSNSGGTGTGTGGVLPPVTGGSSSPPKTAAEIAKEQAIAYGGYRLDVAVGQVAGLTDITNWGTEFKQFLGAVSGIAQTYNLAGVGSEQAAAVQTINSGAIFETKVDDVLSAIQVLLRTLSEKGLGNQFFVEAPPNADLNAKYELIELVNYLQALYG